MQMSKCIDLAGASCRVLQAEAVLSMWLDSANDTLESNLIASIITLLDGVYKTINDAESELLKYK
jgi:hypothetical protein